ncbi:MAG: teichoic acid D-Ala incorporation-associated protein DltX [Chloroflexi bacterium]|nr:teichoic acid D-Ala incorporation-associated protein DltX [Chloroflexota bacterium]
MSTKRWMEFFTAIFRNPWGRILLLVIYYLGILLGLVYRYGEGDLTAPEFIYQGF